MEHVEQFHFIRMIKSHQEILSSLCSKILKYKHLKVYLKCWNIFSFEFRTSKFYFFHLSEILTTFSLSTL